MRLPVQYKRERRKNGALIHLKNLAVAIPPAACYSILRPSVNPRVVKEVSDVNVQLSQRGQGLVEYALIIALVAIVVFAALLIIGPELGNIFSAINSSLAGV
jgi:pilus assembly protein Flp/PilA